MGGRIRFGPPNCRRLQSRPRDEPEHGRPIARLRYRCARAGRRLRGLDKSRPAPGWESGARSHRAKTAELMGDAAADVAEFDILNVEWHPAAFARDTDHLIRVDEQNAPADRLSMVSNEQRSPRRRGRSRQALPATRRGRISRQKAAGLHAVSLGLSALAGDDDRGLLERDFMVYDALFAWLRFAAEERHNWPAKAA